MKTCLSFERSEKNEFVFIAVGESVDFNEFVVSLDLLFLLGQAKRRKK